MKSITIVDFSHLNVRNLFIALQQAQPKKKDGLYITEQFIQYHKHLIFNSLQYIKNKFKNEIILAIDGTNNWRKEVYPLYKANRSKAKEDNDVNFEEFFEETSKILTAIKDNFPFKVIKVDRAEADDIAGVIALEYGNEIDITLVTSDHDWLQVLSHTMTRMWDPIKKTNSLLSDFENTIINTDYGRMSRFTIIHSLIGDKGDGVPTITGFTKFSDNFLSYLRENGIKTQRVDKVSKLDIFEELIDKYEVYTIVKSGYKKGETTDIKDVYKTVPFGIKKAEKASESSYALSALLDSHPMYRDAFVRNRELVDFTKIPLHIKEEILSTFASTEVTYNAGGMLEYFTNEKLGNHISGIAKFYSSKYELTITSSLDDFF